MLVVGGWGKEEMACGGMLWMDHVEEAAPEEVLERCSDLVVVRFLGAAKKSSCELGRLRLGEVL